jgi:hypothetical protein
MILPDQDSTLGFLALGERLRENRTTPQTVELPAGRLLTRAAHWLNGVGDVALVGDGTTLQSLEPSVGLFLLDEPFRVMRWAEPYKQLDVTHLPGHRIESVDAGSMSVRLSERPVVLLAGTTALIAGRIQQFANLHLPEDQWVAFGWPPNFRWFEYTTVAAYEDGVVSLAAPLRHSYDATWRDYPGYNFGPYVAGAARLYPCGHLPRSITFRGINFARAAGATTGAGHVGLSLPALSLTLEDCTFLDDDGSFGATFIQLADTIMLRRCSMGALEIDKCIRRVVIEDCELNGGLSSDGAGALEVELTRCAIRSGDWRINPRTSVVIEDCIFDASAGNCSLTPLHGDYFAEGTVMVNMTAERV